MYASTSSASKAPAMSSSSSFAPSSSSSAASSSRSSPAPHPAASSASSSLFNFSSYPAYVPPSSSLASELDASSVYRGVDHSSSIFALPPSHTSSLAMSTANLSLDDFDSSYASTSHSSASAFPSSSSAHTHTQKKLDIPSFASLKDLSASDFPSPVLSFTPNPASAASHTIPSPVRVSVEPSYLERYTSFYSSMPAAQLLTALTSLLTAHHIDHTLSRNKAKLVVSFQCPMLSSLSVTFILRLYRALNKPNTLIVEGQRREGCVVAFHHVWDRLVKECQVNGLFNGLVEERVENAANHSADTAVDTVTTGVLGMCSLLGNKAAAAASTAHPLSSAPAPVSSATATATVTQPLPSFQLDAAASTILSSLVDNGDIIQQRDALRLLSLSLMSSPSAPTQCQQFLAHIARWASATPAVRSASTSAVCVDDERTAQLARLMLVVTQKGSISAFVGQCAHPLFGLLDSLVNQQSFSDMSMCRLRGLRCLLQVVSQLSSAEGGRVLVPYVGRHERTVLERCAGMPDAAIQQESRAVLQRLGQAF